MAIKLLKAKIFHKRHTPKINAFTYDAYYFSFYNKDKEKLANYFTSLNSFNLFSFYDEDHGNRDGSSLEKWLTNILKKFKLKCDGEIKVITMPRFFGYIFNPVSFWFCYDKDKNLKAVIAEVNNTFKETHSYIVYNSNKDDIIDGEEINLNKQFHVSPFYPREGEYKFRFFEKNGKIKIIIDYYLNKKLTLETSLSGYEVEYNHINLIKTAISIPFIGFKVMFLIHFQALKIWLKGIKYVKKPKQLKQKLTS